jgi:hypothetical protein
LRRGIFILAMGLLVFAVAALIGFAVAARMAPERVRAEAERRLSDVLRGKVVIETLELRWADEIPWLELQGENGHVEGLLNGAGNLDVARISVQLDPLALVLGRLRLRSLELDDAALELRGGPGHPGPAGVGAAEPTDHPVDRWIARLGGWSDKLRERPCIVPDMKVTGLSLAFRQPGRDAVPWVREGVGTFHCSLLGDRGEAELEALWAGPETLTLPLVGHLTTSRDEVEATIRAARGPVAGLARTLGIPTALEGQVGGSLVWSSTSGIDHNLRMRLAGREIRGQLAGSDDPGFVLALDQPRIRVDASTSRGRAAVDLLEITDGGATFQAEAAGSLPIRASTPLRIALALVDVPAESLPHVLAQLAPRLRDPITPMAERFEAGKLALLRLEARTHTTGLLELIRRGVLSRPGEVRLDGRIVDVTLRAGTENRATQLGATVIFDGRRLVVTDVSGRYGERQMPGLELAIAGVDQIRSPDELQCVRPTYVPPMPGLDAALAWAARDDDEEDDWSLLDLEFDWLSHPTLLCGIEDVAVSMRPAPSGLDFTVRRGVWAGVPIEASGRYENPEGAAERVIVAARLGPPFEAMSPTPPENPWARGRFDIEASALGPFAIAGARSSIEVSGALVTLDEVDLALAPAGHAAGGLVLDLSEARPTYELQLEADDLQIAHVAASAGIVQNEKLSGRLAGEAALRGSLVPGAPTLADASGVITLRARDGVLRERIPVLMAIAVASDRFNPFGARDELPYDAIDLVGHVETGKLSIESLTVDAPSLRIGASGTAYVVEPFALEGVVGLFLFPDLDSLVGKVPLLNRVFLGGDESLVGAYFSIGGDWKTPSAELVPMKTLSTSAPASFVLEDVPNFVVGGIKRIQRALTRAPAQQEEGGPREAEPGSPAQAPARADS